VTCAASNGGRDEGINGVADVRGINYVSAFAKTDSPAMYHQRHPTQPIVGSEEGGGPEMWKFAQDNPWYSGYFVWTGFAYYGECKWPYVVAPFGVLDMCGFPRQPAYDLYRKTWAGKPTEDEATGAPAAAIRLDPDRTTLNADGEDTAVVNVTVVDAKNRRVADASDDLTFQISGPGIILGIGNPAGDDHSSAKGNHHQALQGRAQLLLQATKQAGTIKLEVTAGGLRGTSVEIMTTVGHQPSSIP
jgi:hypothetical protein